MLVSETTVLVACLIAIIVAIFLNFKFKVNMGMITMAFAFIIGCLLAGLSVSKVFGFWPDSLIFFMIASALFYGFARENGTLQVFGSKILYGFKNKIALLPWAFMLIAAIMGLLGAGPGTIVLLAPIGYAVAAQVGMNPLLVVFGIDSGYNIGTQNPWTGSGVVMYGLVEANVEGDTSMAFSIYLRSYILFVISKIIMMALMYLFFILVRKGLGDKGAKIEVNLEKPEDYTPLQKKTFALIMVSFCLLVLPNIINTLTKINNPVFKAIVALCKPQAILIIFAVIASMMHLADTKKVIGKLPMNTVLIIAGVGFLMEIAKTAGLLEAVTGLFSDTIPGFLAVPFFCLLAAFLSIFASGTSVVLPLLFPLVPGIVMATGINQVAFYAAAQIGALATPISPFSTAGAQFVSLANEELSERLVKEQFILALVMMALNTLLMLLGFGYLISY